MESLSLKEHYQNQKFNNLHEFFWGFGSAFHTVYAVVPLFLKELGSPEVIASSSAGLFSIIIALPMLIIAALTRNIVNMKKMVISVHCLILLIAFLMGYVFTFSEFGENPNSWKIYFTLFIHSSSMSSELSSFGYISSMPDHNKSAPCCSLTCFS